MVITRINSVEDLYSELINYGYPNYFTSVTQSNSTITCLDGTEAPLIFDSDVDSGWVRIYNLRVYETMLAENAIRIKNIIRTQYGLIITGAREYNSEYLEIPYIIITKDNADNTVIFAHPSNIWDSQYIIKGEFVCMSSAGPEFAKHDSPGMDYSGDLLTSMAPVICVGVMNYCPNLNWIIQKQYNINGELILGTHHYWTDGQIALLDT